MKANQPFDIYSPALSSDQTKLMSTYASESNYKDKQQLKKKKKKKISQPIVSTPSENQQESQKEIDAWIAARKARFPTKSRIQAKEDEQKTREERGALDLTQKMNKPEKPKSNKPIEMSSSHPKIIPSILDKLQEDEERRQRSIVLQCFRYFVKNNFLQKEEETNQFR